MRPRGVSLATTLMAVALAAFAAFTFAALGVFHLHFGYRNDNSARARCAAESAVARAVTTLLEKPTWGRNGESLSFTEADGSEGYITFASTAADITPSINNLERAASVDARNGQVVPPNAVSLVARGRCRGNTALLQVMVQMGPFAYAIAASGPLTSNGGLLVSDVGDDANTLLPGSLLSNMRVDLGAGSRVTGDIHCGGAVMLAANAVVEGEVSENRGPQSLPQMSAADFPPSDTAQVISNPTGNIEIDSVSVSHGPLRIPGALTLKNGILHVRGDLTVEGEMQGTGALVVSGRTHLMRGASVTTDDVVALISDGDVTIDGGARFRGLLYTGGQFSARNVELIGAFVSNPPNGSRSVSLDNVRLLGDPTLSTVTIGGDTRLIREAMTDWGQFKPAANVKGPILHPSKIQSVYLENGRQTQWDGPEKDDYLMNGVYVGAVGTDGHEYGLWITVPDDVTPTRFLDPSTGRFRTSGLTPDNVPKVYALTQHDGNTWKDAIFTSDRAALMQKVNELVPDLADSVPMVEKWYVRALRERLAALDQQVQRGEITTVKDGSNGFYTFDLNEFLRPEDRMRFTLWRLN